MTTQSRLAPPTILLDFKKRRIRIHQHTLRLLGNPEYLRILVNPEEGILALQICEASDVRAHHAKLEKQPLELYSGALLQQLCTCGCWGISQKYKLSGQLVAQEGAVFFKMEDAIATVKEQSKFIP